jgi:hypothetical protein
MSLTPVVPAKLNGFQTFLSKAATDVVKVINAEINIVTAEQPLLNQILPPAYSAAETAATALIKNVMLQTEAKYAAMGTTVSFEEKVADVVEITAPALIQILAGIGVTAGQSELTTLASGALAFGNLQTSGLTTLAATEAAA